jgi:hypothetical protein
MLFTECNALKSAIPSTPSITALATPVRALSIRELAYLREGAPLFG